MVTRLRSQIKRAIALAVLFNGAFAVAAPRNWIKVNLPTELPFISEIYAHSIADSIYRTKSNETFVSPVQHFRRPIKTSFTEDAKTLRTEIFESLKTTPPEKMPMVDFKAGPKRDWVAQSLEVQTGTGGQTVTTCMVFIKADKSVRALFRQGYSVSVPHCVSDLVELSRSPDLDSKGI